MNSAGVLEHKAIYDAAGVTRTTGNAYEAFLRNLLVVNAASAWLKNRIKRFTRSPKRYLTDVSLMAHLIGADVDSVIRDGKLLGRTLDSFVAARIRAELARSDLQPRLHHLRRQDGRRSPVCTPRQNRARPAVKCRSSMEKSMTL